MRDPIRTHKNNLEIENAIKYLVYEVEKYCDNKKPLITHCIRVAFRLDNYQYKKEVVQAALLHDLIEDTKASIEEVKNKFGDRVADLVLATTFDKEIPDKIVRYKTNYENALNFGRDALVIRASDLLENSFYYSLVDDQQTYKYLLDKLSYFLKISKDAIGKEKIYKDLEGRLKILKDLSKKEKQTENTLSSK
jgi:guanosine-3',5'-bis(diphosphate) 3'-pyrophosphohydrolase